MKKITLHIIIASFFSTWLTAQTKIPITEASKHIGEIVIICDKVYGGKFLESSKTQPTLLDLGGIYPNNKLTIFINSDDRKTFASPPETMYLNKNICVTGKVVDYKGKPEIVVSKLSQITVETAGGPPAEINQIDVRNINKYF